MEMSAASHHRFLAASYNILASSLGSNCIPWVMNVSDDWKRQLQERDRSDASTLKEPEPSLPSLSSSLSPISTSKKSSQSSAGGTVIVATTADAIPTSAVTTTGVTSPAWVRLKQILSKEYLVHFHKNVNSHTDSNSYFHMRKLWVCTFKHAPTE